MDKNQVKITKVLDVPIEKVWDAWTNPESLKQWKAPVGMTTPDANVNLSVGGSYYVCMKGGHAGDKTLTVRGVYKEIKKPNRLVFTWKWDGQNEESEVKVLLKKISDSQTELILIHSGFESLDSYKEHNIGWGSTFDKLEEFVEKSQALEGGENI